MLETWRYWEQIADLQERPGIMKWIDTDKQLYSKTITILIGVQAKCNILIRVLAKCHWRKKRLDPMISTVLTFTYKLTKYQVI